MRERLFNIIRKLQDEGWRDDAKLIVVLRQIAEEESAYLIEELLQTLSGH